MMTQERKNVVKLFIIFLFLIMVGFQGVYFYLNSVAKPELYKQQILEHIKKQIGKDVKITGDVRFMLLPSPRLVFEGFKVDNDSTNVLSAPDFSIERIIVYISPMSLFSEHVQLSSVTLVHPVLSLERANDNTVHWEWLNIKLFKILDTKNGAMLPLLIKDGVFNYNDVINNKNFTIENIEAYTSNSAQISVNGKVQSYERIFNFAIDSKVGDLPVSGVEFPLNLHISEGEKNIWQIQSVIDSSGEIPKIIGNFNFNIADMWDLVASPVSSNGSRNGDLQKDRIVMPMAVSGVWNLNGDVVEFNKVIIKGLNSDGGGNASLRWNNWYPTITADLNFANIDYLMWKKLIESRIFVRTPIKFDEFQADDVQSFDFRKENPLPENIEIKLNINAEKISLGSGEWRHTRLNAVLDGGALTINQCDINLDGDGLLSIFGVISQGGDGDLRFEGNMEAKGKSLHKAISMFYSSAIDLPDIGTGAFSVSSNLYINSGQIRLFEAKATIDSTPILGTLTAYFGEQPRIEIQIKLKDVNFDQLRDRLRKEHVEFKKEKKKDIIEASKNFSDASTNVPPVIGFDWLRNLTTRLDVRIYVDGFIFMDRKGDRASFVIYAYGGDLRLSNVQLTYPEGTDDLSCNLDVRGAIPYISMIVNANKLDTNYFNLSSKELETILSQDSYSREIPKNELSKKEEVDFPIPLGWMDYINGSFDITLRKLTHKNIFMENIKLQAKLENKVLNIQKLGFIYSQAQSNVIGTLYGGKVPGLEVNFTMANADIYEMLSSLVGIHNISGYTNLSGTVSTSGWSFREWLQQMDAKLFIAANGVKVQGINIAGVSNMVDVANSSADVFNNVNNVLTDGVTEFLVNGTLNIKDGELRAPSLSLRTGLVTGTVTGGVNLESLVGQISMLFRFSNLSPELVPVMIVQLSGHLNKPDIKVDTASLEDFVAKRNVAK